MKKFQLCIALMALSTFLIANVASATLIDDFSGGVTAVNHPDPANGGTNAFNVWYDFTNDTFGTPAAGTLSGSPAMNIVDGGFTNGIYAIYEAVIPADGIYTVSVDMLVNDTATSDMADYQIGAVVNGVHRGANPSDLAAITGVGHYTGLTPDVLDATVIQKVTTASFSASAGDNLLIALGTSVDAAEFDNNSGFWNSATVDVDNITLDLIPEPTSVALLGLGTIGMLLARRRRS